MLDSGRAGIRPPFYRHHSPPLSCVFAVACADGDRNCKCGNCGSSGCHQCSSRGGAGHERHGLHLIELRRRLGAGPAFVGRQRAAESMQIQAVDRRRNHRLRSPNQRHPYSSEGGGDRSWGFLARRKSAEMRCEGDVGRVSHSAAIEEGVVAGLRIIVSSGGFDSLAESR